MTVITLSITESAQQIISGIPVTVMVTANLPSTIFYTLDGTQPTVMSAVYVGAITLPSNQNTVVLKVFASNGTDSSSVTTLTYAPDISTIRKARNTVLNAGSNDNINRYPFGNGTQIGTIYGPPSNLGAVDLSSVENIPDGYDGTATGTPSNGTDKPKSQYRFIYSETNRLGERGNGIGTVPGTVTLRVPEVVEVSSSSDANSKFFNPRAMVIFQDGRDAPYDPNMPRLNREFFSLQNPERTKDGQIISTAGHEGNTISGSLIRSNYNPTENTITYYYRDHDTGRWIIATEPYRPNNSGLGSLAHVVLSSRQNGVGIVFPWIPFASRKLI